MDIIPNSLPYYFYDVTTIFLSFRKGKWDPEKKNTVFVVWQSVNVNMNLKPGNVSSELTSNHHSHCLTGKKIIAIRSHKKNKCSRHSDQSGIHTWVTYEVLLSSEFIVSN